MLRQADIVILVLGVLAATATLVGALSGDRWTDERTVRFTTSASALEPGGLAPANGAGTTFNWTVPANATSASVVARLYFQGQAVTGGSATVSLRFTGPDGKAQPPITSSWAIPQGATSAETQVNATATWLEVPAAHRDTTSSAAGRRWAEPLRLQVLVDKPSDVPLSSYAFTAGVTGEVTSYAAQ